MKVKNIYAIFICFIHRTKFFGAFPGTIPLTDEQFQIFLEKTVATEHSRRILDGLNTQTKATPSPSSAITEAQDEADEDEDDSDDARVKD